MAKSQVPTLEMKVAAMKRRKKVLRRGAAFGWDTVGFCSESRQGRGWFAYDQIVTRGPARNLLPYTLRSQALTLQDLYDTLSQRKRHRLARDHRMHLVYSLGMAYLPDSSCFGKVLRLMAADVARWHRLTGGGLDPNTQVWNSLPFPWQVFREETFCTRNMVVAACKLAGLDPEKSG